MIFLFDEAPRRTYTFFEYVIDDMTTRQHKRTRKPVYEQVADMVSQQIIDGRLNAGERLPTESEMAGQLGLSRLTVRRGYQLLQTRNVIVQQRGKGSFVTPNAYESLRIPNRRKLRNVAFAFDAESLESVPTWHNFIVQDHIAGLMDRFHPAHINLCHFPIRTDKNAATDGALDDLADRLGGFDAVAFEGVSDLDLIWRTHERGVPCVTIAQSSPWPQIPAVVYNRRQAVQLAAQHLLACGYRRLGYIGENIDLDGMHDMSAEQKFFTFLSCIQPAGATLCVQHHHTERDLPPGEAYRAASKIIREGPLPEAFFVDTDCRAIEVMNALKNEGIQVPDDVGVMGYDGIVEGAATDPPLTTVLTPRRALGQRSAEVLMYPDQHAEASVRIVVDAKLETRESTRIVTGMHDDRTD